METLPSAQPGSPATNPNSVKSDDSSPRPESGRGSPPPNCAICLGTCKNKSFTDSCLHQFCFSCLLTWSKVKAECPLCKQIFKSIIHNVRSNHQYEEYMVEQRHTEESLEIDGINISSLSNARRFRYRTTMTLPRRDSIAIEQLLLSYPLVGLAPPPAHRAPPPRRRSPTSFRRTVYRHNLWARPLPDFTGRFRDCSPAFYRYNDAQMHRLVPWLNRELHYLLNENLPHISYVLTRILELLPQYHISSPEFRAAMHYFGDRTEHFLHELYCFASTPYDMTGYDRHVQYTTDPRISTMVNEVISSSDTEASVDSDIVMVSSSEPAAAAAGPSRPAEPFFPLNYLPNDSVIPIETISHSDTDDGSEVMVVGYIKPPQDRTPEVVDLLGSDSDVVVQETPMPGPSQPVEESTDNAQLVKLSLKRHVSRDEDTDSDDNYVRPPHTKPAKRRRLSRSLSSTATWCSNRTWRSSSNTEAADSDASTSIPSPCSTTSAFNTSDTSDTDYSPRHRKSRKKVKPRQKSPSKSRADCGKSKTKKKSRKSRKNQSTQTQRKGKNSKLKSHSGKDVKSSKKNDKPTVDATAEQDQPSTSSASNASQKENIVNSKKKNKLSREGKKLKSVVKVMKQQPSDSNGYPNLLNIVESAILNPNSNVLAYNSDSGSIPGEDRPSRINSVPPDIMERVESCFNMKSPVSFTSNDQSDLSDSGDDLPLNLTMRRN